jgi:hypothetical protein
VRSFVATMNQIRRFVIEQRSGCGGPPAISY